MILEKTNFNNSEDRPKAILVGMGLKSDQFSEIKSNLIELTALATTAGFEVVGVLSQRVHRWSPKTLIGPGKVEELKVMVEQCSAHQVIMDQTLNGVQTRNLEEILKPARVIDRNQIIIDIFAQRANSYEGKLQVEMARLMDELPRQVGAWMGSLSRQGAGIGTRGLGEKAIELDRRQIRKRMAHVRKKLKEVQKNRRQHRKSREKNRVPSFALIGYTNSGKSTLMKSLTKSDVLIEDRLFATLDPVTRKIFLKKDLQAVLTDTVGFIHKLPHHLISAFRATFEELSFSQILLHVIDLASPRMEKQIQVVETLIHDLDWQKKPLIHLFNKTDLAPIQNQFKIKERPRVFISAKTGEGLNELKALMIQSFEQMKKD